jgi:hypothetical protein
MKHILVAGIIWLNMTVCGTTPVPTTPYEQDKPEWDNGGALITSIYESAVITIGDDTMISGEGDFCVQLGVADGGKVVWRLADKE